MRSRLAQSLAFVLLTSVLALPAWGQEQEQQGQETVVDPWEGFNRNVHQFNDVADRWVLRPIAKGYVNVTPDSVERGVSNVFGNLLEVRNIVNDVLQWKWKQAGNDSGRFLINSTLGIAGIFDVARHMKLEKSEGEDFGQTLAAWGVNSGPYLVLPFLGPSTIRDTVSLPADWLVHPIDQIDHVRTRNIVRALDFVNTRAELLKAEAFVSGDRYIFLREAYLQRRDYLIQDGDVADDDFGSFGGGDYDDYEDDEEDPF